jgi:hypothetical protein
MEHKREKVRQVWEKLLTSMRARLLSLRSVKGVDGGSTLVGSWLPGWSPPGVSLVRGGDNNRRQHAEAERAAGGDGPTEARSAGAVTPRDGWDAGIGARAALQRLTVDAGATRVVCRAPSRQLHESDRAKKPLTSGPPGGSLLTPETCASSAACTPW